MECKIKQDEPTYSFELNGNSFPGFRVESRWQGFVKYVNNGKLVITYEDPSPLTLFVGMLLQGELAHSKARIVALAGFPKLEAEDPVAD